MSDKDCNINVVSLEIGRIRVRGYGIFVRKQCAHSPDLALKADNLQFPTVLSQCLSFPGLRMESLHDGDIMKKQHGLTVNSAKDNYLP